MEWWITALGPLPRCICRQPFSRCSGLYEAVCLERARRVASPYGGPSGGRDGCFAEDHVNGVRWLVLPARLKRGSGLRSLFRASAWCHGPRGR